jgi:hypothetical protein
MNALSNDDSYPSFDGWEERLGDPGATLPSKLPEPADRTPAVLVCAVAVGLALLAAACFWRWAVMS